MQAIAYILTVVFIAAVIGIIKPYFRDFSRKQFAILAAVSFVLIGVVAPRPEFAEGPRNVPQDDRTAEPDEIPPTDRVGRSVSLATRADFEAQQLEWPLTVEQAGAVRLTVPVAD